MTVLKPPHQVPAIGSWHSQILCFLGLSIVCVLASLSSPALAAPVLSQSHIRVSSEAPLEGDVVRFTVSLKNTGDVTAEFAQLKIEWPFMGYLVQARGVEPLAVDHSSRTLSSSVTLAPSEEKNVEVDILVPRDSGGDALSLSVRLAHYASGTEYWDHKVVTVDTRIPPNGIRIGSFRLAPAGIATLAWLIVSGVFWAWVRVAAPRNPSSVRLLGPGAAVVAIMIAVGFGMIFTSMAWRDYRALNEWQQTTATIVGRGVVSQSTTSHPPSSGISTARKTTEIVSPEFALRYSVNGIDILSTGYDTGSSLRIGGRVQREEEMAHWTVGAQIPCWYDPQEPRDVVVRRGFGGAYLFALFPLLLFWFGLRRLRSAFFLGRA